MTGWPRDSAEPAALAAPAAGQRLADVIGRWLSRKPWPLIRGRAVYLRPPRRWDFDSWRALRQASRAHLEPWEPAWPEDAFDRRAFRARLRHHALEARRDEAHALFVFSRKDHALLGGLTLSNIRRGAIQSASVGYWIGARHAGQGAMTDALSAACGFGLNELGLHRIEAACMIENLASRRVLEKAGFRQEGVARAYRQIAGQWRDHLLFARMTGDPVP
ncbi:MAG: GNAT family N-acetyltransferase [Alphaproteobacteria bacterium]|nr:GNAT family N-acetyltransferase [Alphaproteobacteria bacterium]